MYIAPYVAELPVLVVPYLYTPPAFNCIFGDAIDAIVVSNGVVLSLASFPLPLFLSILVNVIGSEYTVDPAGPDKNTPFILVTGDVPLVIGVSQAQHVVDSTINAAIANQIPFISLSLV
jgi:hypothetical protein